MSRTPAVGLSLVRKPRGPQPTPKASAWSRRSQLVQLTEAETPTARTSSARKRARVPPASAKAMAGSRRSASREGGPVAQAGPFFISLLVASGPHVIVHCDGAPPPSLAASELRAARPLQALASTPVESSALGLLRRYQMSRHELEATPPGILRDCPPAQASARPRRSSLGGNAGEGTKAGA